MSEIRGQRPDNREKNLPSDIPHFFLSSGIGLLLVKFKEARQNRNGLKYASKEKN
jgi:hypothetical protein